VNASARDDDRAAVVVVGMHRSGTSLLTRLLGLAGVELGREEELAGPAFDNPRGFWEHEELRAVDDELLALLGGSWAAPPPEPLAERLAGPECAPQRARARTLLDERFGAARVFGFKDPRASLLVPFWRDLLPQRTAWVLALRHPLEVMDSLARRNGLPRLVAEDLWRRYTVAAWRDAPEGARTVVRYERLLEDPVAEVERVREVLDLPLPPLDDARRAAIRAEADPGLRHHRPEDGRLAELQPETRELLAWLSAPEPGPLPPHLLRAAEPPPLRRELQAATAVLLSDRDHLQRALAQREEALQAARAEAERLGDELRREQEAALRFAGERDAACERLGALEERLAAVERRLEVRLGRRLRRLLGKGEGRT